MLVEVEAAAAEKAVAAEVHPAVVVAAAEAAEVQAQEKNRCFGSS